jgi:hypothetical protein
MIHDASAFVAARLLPRRTSATSASRYSNCITKLMLGRSSFVAPDKCWNVFVRCWLTSLPLQERLILKEAIHGSAARDWSSVSCSGIHHQLLGDSSSAARGLWGIWSLSEAGVRAVTLIGRALWGESATSSYRSFVYFLSKISVEFNYMVTPKIPWDQKLVDCCLGSLCKGKSFFFHSYF